MSAAPAEVPVVPDAVETPVAADVAPVVGAACRGDSGKLGRPEMIEVWRPGRPPEERRAPRPQGERRERRERRPRPPQAASPQERAPRPLRRTVPLRPKRLRPRRRAKRSRTSIRATAAIAPNEIVRSARGGRRRASGVAATGRIARIAASDRARAGATSGSRSRSRRRARMARPERRGVADPNSPFAKLAALKEQLEANKER